MCGVIGLVYERQRDDLGRVAADLLKTLEYRGYDSTGGAFQGDGLDVVLKKGVGAPSAMVHKLGIAAMSGRAFCGQVRWATFGAVTDENSQPHIVRCHTFLYGAHNGNVTNCDDLKAWLTAEGHDVQSDNDGEMVVHTVEHFFARELERPVGPAEAGPYDSITNHKSQNANDPDRRAAMRRALIASAQKLRGSFAAVIVDPVTRTMWAVKQGSSLYFGFGADDGAGRFAIASSDLSSVLKLTQDVVPVNEGEFVEYDPSAHHLYAVEDRTTRASGGVVTVKAGDAIARDAVRTRLRAADTGLQPPFKTFMEQEIAAQEPSAREMVSLFLGRDADSPVADDEAAEFTAAVERFSRIAADAVAARGRLYAVCCGSSYHAAKAASLFFNEMAHVELTPMLPGEFRGQSVGSLMDGDLVIAVSQSGETKDLIDVLNDVIASGRDVARVGLVNNVNSTIALGEVRPRDTAPVRSRGRGAGDQEFHESDGRLLRPRAGAG